MLMISNGSFNFAYKHIDVRGKEGVDVISLVISCFPMIVDVRKVSYLL